jgi:hypothetical protein
MRPGAEQPGLFQAVKIQWITSAYRLQTSYPAAWGLLMIVRQNQASWQQGYNDGFAGKPSRPIKVPDELAYASGFIEGKAARETKGGAPRVKRPRLCVVRKS